MTFRYYELRRTREFDNVRRPPAPALTSNSLRVLFKKIPIWRRSSLLPLSCIIVSSGYGGGGRGARFVSYLKRGVSFESRPSAAGSNRLPISFAKVRMLECTECPNSTGGKFALNKTNLFHMNPYALWALKTLFGSSLSGNKHWGH